MCSSTGEDVHIISTTTTTDTEESDVDRGWTLSVLDLDGISAASELRSYGHRLRYECGLARRFLDEELEETYEERWLTCNWNTSWTEFSTLDTCVWVQVTNRTILYDGLSN